jgi:hypothetical protein
MQKLPLIVQPSGLSPFKPVFVEIFIEYIGLLKKEIKVFTNITL